MAVPAAESAPGLEIRHEGRRLVVVWSWASLRAATALALAVGLGALAYNLGFPLVPLVLWAGAVGSAYWGAALAFNRTQVEVTPETLTVTSGPVPWPQVAPLRTEAIRSIWIKEITTRAGNDKLRGMVSSNWELWVEVADEGETADRRRVGGAFTSRRQADAARDALVAYCDTPR